MNKLIFLLLILLLPISLLAEELEPEVEKITVSATRQAAGMLDVASNISQINQDTLQLIEHQHINQALVRVPGGWISRGNGQEHLTAIRSPVLTGAGGCGAFYIAQDGISARAPGFCNANQLFDLNTLQAANIEVIRGPASTFYGSNAVHGVINILTPEVFDQQPGQFALNLGPHGYQRALFKLSSV
ncbi:TonB-dependent receptor [Paraglaciecola aestuariivivens]